MLVNISDLRRAARKRLPRAIFDYVDGGSEDEHTRTDRSPSFALFAASVFATCVLLL